MFYQFNIISFHLFTQITLTLYQVFSICLSEIQMDRTSSLFAIFIDWQSHIVEH